ncbi:hypothetical protein [Krasilnikovia sp. MM14-A1259]|uniref:hypothetical protein n=1 Tax=Krasilnikovia sp. MM14-A1259 TaxID=3373539 RepID=UPI0037F4CC69
MRGQKLWGLAGVAAVLAVGTGCTAQKTTTTPPAPAATGSTATGSTPAATPSASKSATGQPSKSGAPKGSTTPSPAHTGTSAAGFGCPVTGATLVKALYADPSDIKDRLAKTATLSGVECYEGYALGRTNPKDADHAMVVFRYDAARHTWHPVSGGTAGYCDNVVPSAVRKHLTHCN